MMDSGRYIRLLYNGLLVGTTCYAMFKISWHDHPYGFSACLIGCGCGLIGLTDAFFGHDNEDDCKKVKSLSKSLLEIAPLPLVNIELYLQSQGTSILALGHGIFLLPLTLDIMCCLIRNSRVCYTADTLKDLTVLGNIVSLAFLAVNERNLLYGRMAIMCLLTKYTSIVLDCYSEGSGSEVLTLGSAGFFYLCTYALTETLKN